MNVQRVIGFGRDGKRVALYEWETGPHSYLTVRKAKTLLKKQDGAVSFKCEISKERTAA